MKTVIGSAHRPRYARRASRHRFAFCQAALATLRITAIYLCALGLAFGSQVFLSPFSLRADAGPLDDLPPGHWYQVPNSKIRDVLPTPIPPGWTGPEAIIIAWSGGAYDTTRNRYLVWGGGHADYCGNEIYAFDLNTLKWSRLWGPSAAIPTSGTWEAYPDGNPAARHTYDGLTYIPAVDKFLAVGGSLCWGGSLSTATWLFNFATATWQRGPDLSNDHVAASAAYDPLTRRVYVQANRVFAEYDPQTGTYTARGAIDAGLWANPTAAIDPVRRLFVMAGGGKVRVWNLNSWRYSEPSTVGGAIVLSNQAPGFKYDPVRNLFVGWVGGATVYELNPDTWVWTARPPAPSNTVVPSPSPPQGTYGRFQYSPSKNLYIVVNSIDENVWVYRLSSTPPAEGSPPAAPTSLRAR